MKSKAFGYIRVSGKGQIKGDGFMRQEKAIHDYAKTKGIEITKVYREKGVSGTLANRPALLELIDRHGGNWMIQKGTGKIIAIDNGLMFHAAKRDFSYTWIGGFRWNEVPQETKTYVKSFIDNKANIISMMKADLGTGAGKAIRIFSKRIGYLEEWTLNPTKSLTSITGA